MTLRWYQEEAVAAAWRYIRQHKGNPCICAPTGSGKSHMIAELVTQAVRKWQGRVIILAHRKELLVQNADKLNLPMPVGIYSAGLNQRDTQQDVVLAGIQSCYKRACEFDRRDLVIIDEAHLIPHHEDTMYRTFLEDMQAVNPHAKVIGLTATPYRTGLGCITDGGVLDEICYTVDIERLIEEGFLCKLTNTVSKHSIDASKLSIRGGEFSTRHMESTFQRHFHSHFRDMMDRVAGRKSILIFTSGVLHAEQIAAALDEIHESVGLVLGDTPPLERAAHLKRFKQGQLRWLVNCDVLTTGFDAPNIDAIVVLRATMSPGLFAQMCGRGFRIAEGKEDCLVLDYGGNIGRHGPLNDPGYGKREVEKEVAAGEGESPIKVCEHCGSDNHLRNAFCWKCKAAFPIENKLEDKPDEQSQILSQVKSYHVEQMSLVRHVPRDPEKRDSLRADYLLSAGEGNLETIRVSEWICIEHSGYPRQKAYQWWMEHTYADLPDTIDEATELYAAGALRVPAIVYARQEGRWWRITHREFDVDRPEDWADLETLDPYESEIPF